MGIPVKCPVPGCREAFEVLEREAGTEVPCPRCGTNIGVPDRAAQAESEAAEVTEVLEPKPGGSEPKVGGYPAGAFPGYRLVRSIAKGCMGEVFEAVQLELDRRVALKVLTGQFSTDPSFLQRFEREAKSAAHLNHPNIVQIYDFVRGGPRPCLIMELVEGENLHTLVQQQGKLGLPDALEKVLAITRALQEAHRHHIIHRDIKPANVLLSSRGDVKVSDLGLAKKLDEDLEVTATGVGMGSPHFIAPEQADDARAVDHRADIYSLGITLLYLLTARKPFEGESAYSVVLAHATKPLPSGRDLGTELPGEVEAVIRRMAAKKPEDRYPDYGALVRDLEQVRAGAAPTEETLALGRMATQEMDTIPNVPRASFPGGAGDTSTAAGGRSLLLASTLGGGFLVLLALGIGWMLWGNKNGGEGSQAGAPQFVPANQQAETSRLPRGPLAAGRKGLRAQGGTFAGQQNMPGHWLNWKLPERSVPSDNPLEKAPVEVMWKEAEAYGASHPAEFQEILARYEQVAQEAEGTPLETRVRENIEFVKGEQIIRAELAFSQYTDDMHRYLQQGQPETAWAVWESFPMALRDKELDEKITQSVRAAMETLPPPPEPRNGMKRRPFGPNQNQGPRGMGGRVGLPTPDAPQ